MGILLKDCGKIMTLSENEKENELENLSIYIEKDKIKKIDSYDNLIDQINEDIEIIDCSKKTVLPGFVDPHTHLVFGGDRLDEYVAKLTITDPNEIKKRVGLVGLASSIYQTGEAGYEGLMESSLEKLNNLLLNGITTVEIKSGYGIDKDVELTQLKVIRDVEKKVPQTIISTYLGGHDWDKEMGKDKYLEFMLNEVMPIVAKENLADMVDIWVEDVFFSTEQGKKYLKRAKELGLNSTIHGNELSSIGASKMAAQEGAFSVAHLNYITEEEIDIMIEKNVVGIVLPTTDYVKQYDDNLANGRHLIDRGLTVALATNINPGNYTVSMSLVMDMACRRHGFTPYEALKGATLNAAKALRIEKEYGSIEVGKYADLQIWDTDDYQNVVYRHGMNFVETVIKHGNIVVKDRKLVY